VRPVWWLGRVIGTQQRLAIDVTLQIRDTPEGDMVVSNDDFCAYGVEPTDAPRPTRRRSVFSVVSHVAWCYQAATLPDRWRS